MEEFLRSRNPAAQKMCKAKSNVPGKNKTWIAEKLKKKKRKTSKKFENTSDPMMAFYRHRSTKSQEKKDFFLHIGFLTVKRLL